MNEAMKSSQAQTRPQRGRKVGKHHKCGRHGK